MSGSLKSGVSSPIDECFSVNTLFYVDRVAFKGMAFLNFFDLKSYWSLIRTNY